MKFIILISVAVALCSAGEVNFREILSPSRPNYDDVSYGNCQAGQDTMDTHPFDCTRFIKCHNGRAADMACGDCHVNTLTCPLGYLVWNQSRQVCDWADQTECAVYNPTDAPGTDAPATDAPATDAPVTDGPVTDGPVTDGPVTDGPECNDDCVEEGDCIGYRVCQDGKWVSRTCEPETWWNPNVGPHGGVCDFWDNLSDDLQHKYREDPACPAPLIPCYWRPDANCDNKYYWLEEGSKTNSTEVPLTCPSAGGVSLVWDQDSKSCVHCNPGPCTIC